MVGVPTLANAPSPNSESIPNWNESYVEEVYVPFVPLPELRLFAASPYTYCSCVEFAKATLGQSGTWGNARNILVNSQTPTVGGLVLTFEGPGHVAVVTGVTETSIEIVEANYRRCAKTTRVILRSSPLIRGYRTLK